MSATFPETPKTLIDELCREGELDELKWRQFDELYRPVVSFFLMQRFGSPVRDHEDVVQSVMIKLVDILRRGCYKRDVAKFRTFLSALAYNCCVDHLRRVDRRREVALGDVDLDAILSDAAEQRQTVMLDRQWAEACHLAARRHVLKKYPLNPVHRKVFLALEGGSSVAEIAEQNGMSQSAVRQIRHRISELIDAFAREYADR